MNFDELKKIVKEAGVVGAGGAGFPSYAKFDKSVDTLILNCAECEPLLRLHRSLLEKNAYEIMWALDLISKIIDAKNVIIEFSRIGLPRYAVYLIVAELAYNPFFKLFNLFFVAVEKLHKACLRTRRTLHATKLDMRFKID